MTSRLLRLQRIATRLLPPDLLDQPGFEQWPQQIHGSLPGRTESLPQFRRSHAAMVGEQFQQLLLSKSTISQVVNQAARRWITVI